MNARTAMNGFIVRISWKSVFFYNINIETKTFQLIKLFLDSFAQAWTKANNEEEPPYEESLDVESYSGPLKNQLRSAFLYDVFPVFLNSHWVI